MSGYYSNNYTYKSFPTIHKALMKLFQILFCLLISIGITHASSNEESMPPKIAKTLKKFGLSNDSISINIADVDSNTTLLNLNPDTVRNPASTMKILTSLAALDILGAGHLWRTGFYRTKSIEDDTLQGDLFIRAGGDPLILLEDMLASLLALRLRGIRKIAGNLVIDSSIYDESTINSTPLDGKRDRVYNVPPSALSINFRATQFIFSPDRDRLKILAYPPAINLRITNEVQLIRGNCNGAWRKLLPSTSASSNTTHVRFTGTYPKSCGEQSITRSIQSSDQYIYGVFGALWKALGGSIAGKLGYASVPDDAKLIYERVSRPMFDVLRGINKYSNNLMARMLLLGIGGEVYNEPSTPEAGRLAIKEWLTKQSLNLPGLIIDNGSGLSRNSRITAAGLGSLLQYARNHIHYEEFAASLSLSGIDGSTRKRFSDENNRGRFRLKTGLLNGVRTVAGFSRTVKGTNLRIVILHNHPKVNYSNGNAIQNTILKYANENF